jgi:hypothetical protein
MYAQMYGSHIHASIQTYIYIYIYIYVYIIYIIRWFRSLWRKETA